ncbi:MAG: hypothetical protein GWO87_00065 [Xanthomonadaceae bacterium]|nr:hypothetical protein [Rhodospirillaceae bacterium]NIA17575.1 hypothetical protein [Xanthomonadaceae bacterium]
MKIAVETALVTSPQIDYNFKIQNTKQLFYPTIFAGLNLGYFNFDII